MLFTGPPAPFQRCWVLSRTGDIFFWALSTRSEESVTFPSCTPFVSSRISVSVAQVSGGVIIVGWLCLGKETPNSWLTLAKPCCQQPLVSGWVRTAPCASCTSWPAPSSTTLNIRHLVTLSPRQMSGWFWFGRSVPPAAGAQVVTPATPGSCNYTQQLRETWLVSLAKNIFKQKKLLTWHTLFNKLTSPSVLFFFPSIVLRLQCGKAAESSFLSFLRPLVLFCFSSTIFTVQIQQGVTSRAGCSRLYFF